MWQVLIRSILITVSASVHIIPTSSATPPTSELIKPWESMSTEMQRAVWCAAQIVVATNIAETSITIEDCTFVVDTGRVKENSYSPATHICCLLERWTSRASAKQRRGRAGRVAPGAAPIMRPRPKQPDCQFELCTHFPSTALRSLGFVVRGSWPQSRGHVGCVSASGQKTVCVKGVLC